MTDRHRCFLFLVNYARMKPDVALKALPTLQDVSGAIGQCQVIADAFS